MVLRETVKLRKLSWKCLILWKTNNGRLKVINTNLKARRESQKIHLAIYNDTSITYSLKAEQAED